MGQASTVLNLSIPDAKPASAHLGQVHETGLAAPSLLTNFPQEPPILPSLAHFPSGLALPLGCQMRLAPLPEGRRHHLGPYFRSAAFVQRGGPLSAPQARALKAQTKTLSGHVQPHRNCTKRFPALKTPSGIDQSCPAKAPIRASIRCCAPHFPAKTAQKGAADGAKDLPSRLYRQGQSAVGGAAPKRSIQILARRTCSACPRAVL